MFQDRQVAAGLRARAHVSGPQCLSTAELMVLLANGLPTKTSRSKAPSRSDAVSTYASGVEEAAPRAYVSGGVITEAERLIEAVGVVGNTLHATGVSPEIRLLVRSAIELAARVVEPLSGESVTSPKMVMEYLTRWIGHEPRELFAIVFLDNKHRIIAKEIVAYGTIDSCTLHPREVVRRVLELNSAAIIASHNHPTKSPEPSCADIALTRRLKDSLALVDCRLIDHVVVGGQNAVSMAERGLV